MALKTALAVPFSPVPPQGNPDDIIAERDVCSSDWETIIDSNWTQPSTPEERVGDEEKAEARNMMQKLGERRR